MRVVRFESWAERQIREAQERGEFDNLPGAGKPLAAITGRPDEEDWWVRGLLEREQLPMPLPTSLALRREVAELPATLADVPTEAEVREIVADLNRRVLDSHRRRVDGPPVVVRPVDVEAVVEEWRQGRAAARPERSGAMRAPARRWRRRRGGSSVDHVVQDRHGSRA